MTDPQVLFLDVDHTLYDESCGLWAAVRGRIQGYIELKLGLTPADSEALRTRFYRQYGTTLRGLQQEYEVDPQDYLRFVHDVPVDQLLRPDPALRSMLAALAPRTYYFTNAYRPYTERVLERLGLLDLGFEIIDILAMQFENKPLPGAYRRALEIAGEPDPGECVLVDDLPANLIPAAELGMRTVLVGQPRDGLNGRHLTIARITELLDTLPELRRQ